MTETASATGECPSEDELVGMVEGVATAETIAAIEAHIDSCDDCASVVAGLGAAGSPPKQRQVGRYLLDRKIAADDKREIWTAWDPTLRRDIAVKLVHPDRADQGRDRERLLREARALARPTHPNVATVQEVGEAGGDVFIVTDLLVADTTDMTALVAALDALVPSASAPPIVRTPRARVSAMVVLAIAAIAAAITLLCHVRR